MFGDGGLATAFFGGFGSLLRVVPVAICAYAGLILVLRVAGKRSLAKLNAFDFAVTVAFGSTLATVLLSEDAPVAEGLAAFAMLAGLQYLISSTSLHARWVERLVRSEPRLLFEDGRFLDGPMRRERVTRREVEAAIRNRGIGRLEEVAAVVLETDGSLSVIRGEGARGLSALRSVARPDRE